MERKAISAAKQHRKKLQASRKCFGNADEGGEGVWYRPGCFEIY